MDVTNEVMDWVPIEAFLMGPLANVEYCATTIELMSEVCVGNNDEAIGVVRSVIGYSYEASHHILVSAWRFDVLAVCITAT